MGFCGECDGSLGGPFGAACSCPQPHDEGPFCSKCNWYHAIDGCEEYQRRRAEIELEKEHEKIRWFGDVS